MRLTSDIALKGIRYLLRPVVRFALRHSLRIQELGECLKLELLEVAQQELEAAARKVTQSSLSASTGLRRREVQRLLEGHTRLTTPRSLIAKVVARWRDLKQFQDSHGSPLPLKFPEQFSLLVQEVSADLNPASVCRELERVGVVEQLEGEVRLKTDNYIPRGDTLAGLGILANDCNDLTRAVEDNVLLERSPPHHHLRTEFDKIQVGALPEIRRWLLREGHAFHLRVRAELSKYDQDVNPLLTENPTTTRVVFGSFGFIEEPNASAPHGENSKRTEK